jgi:hypothetical protein
MRVAHLLVLGLWVAPFSASAGSGREEALANFAQSIKDLYAMAVLCQDTLTPSPSYYSQHITEYMYQYYEAVEGQYWVLPVVTHRSENPEYCLTGLDRHVMRYRMARNNFSEFYPEMPQPPNLVRLNELGKPKQAVTRYVRKKPELPARQTTPVWSGGVR